MIAIYHSLQPTQDGRFSSASRFTAIDPGCLSSERQAETLIYARCLFHIMKKTIALLFATMLTLAAVASDVSYSTEATITPGKNKRQCQIVVHISKITEQDGEKTETLLSSATSVTDLGKKAWFFVGNDDPKTECVSVDVFCPKSISDFTLCVVTVTRGGLVLSKTATKLKMYEQ